MTRISAIALCLFTITMTILCGSFCQAGWNYMEIGYGLHPALAYPLAVLCLLVLVPTWYWVISDIEYDAAVERDAARHPTCDIL